MRGLIICGYPGVGKTSIAGRQNCIDLESSLFSYDVDGDPLDPNIWVSRYCAVAIDLAMQGYTVLTSTHARVIDGFENSDDQQKIPKVIFCPRLNMKEAWTQRLKDRYQRNPSEKNWRAYEHVLKHFDKIVFLSGSTLPCFSPKDMDYDFDDCVYTIKNIVHDPFLRTLTWDEFCKYEEYHKDICVNPIATELYFRRIDKV